MWITRRHDERQSPLESFRFGESEPPTVVAVQKSSADDLIRFLKNPCGHNFIIQRERLDVARQTDTEHQFDATGRRRAERRNQSYLRHPKVLPAQAMKRPA
jgi:hypothetical protein